MLIAAALVLLIMLAYVLWCVPSVAQRWPGSRSSSKDVYQKEAELQTRPRAGAAEERGAPAAGGRSRPERDALLRRTRELDRS